MAKSGRASELLSRDARFESRQRNEISLARGFVFRPSKFDRESSLKMSTWQTEVKLTFFALKKCPCTRSTFQIRP
jgi:hypothetical protein